MKRSQVKFCSYGGRIAGDPRSLKAPVGVIFGGLNGNEGPPGLHTALSNSPLKCDVCMNAPWLELAAHRFSEMQKNEATFSPLNLKRNMFIIDLNYIVPLPQLDGKMPSHVKFLRKYYKLNVFVASGRKVPRTGGIILALADSRDEIERIMEEDPFIVHGLADFTVIEFLTSQYHGMLKELLTRKAS